MNRILFIEDDRTKCDDISKYIYEIYENEEIIIKESFTSGLRELFTNNYQMLLLDMSLPTREGNLNNSINNFEQLGGYKILNEMKRKNRTVPTILITMFHEFGIGSSYMNLEEINNICKLDFSNFFIGCVYYTSKEDSWKENLRKYLDKLL